MYWGGCRFVVAFLRASYTFRTVRERPVIWLFILFVHKRSFSDQCCSILITPGIFLSPTFTLWSMSYR
ncbi:hypothetical protein [Bacillus pretiosus]|uniref:hypothetical protein n=1 Tax=Bacillus pretiosus TaxID=2983392 RepID=UPI003D661789